MYYLGISFEFDPEKSRRNLEKHGISFEEARNLWAAFGVEREAAREPEMRWIRIAIWQGRCYTCVFTVRDHRIRIISTRRSRQDEMKLYHGRMANEKESEKDFS